MRTRGHGRADLRDRIRDLQRMDDSPAELVDTCDRPRADRRCALLDAINHGQHRHGSQVAR